MEMSVLEEMRPSFEVRLSPTDRAPAAARQSLDRLAGRLDPAGLETMRLLVSELVTNSVRHARLEHTGWINLSVEEHSDAVRVAVTDPGVGFDERPGPPQPGDPSGWGLHLVEQLADRWGISRDGETKVWFEIERPVGS
jgi:anti-sigma regulatory factor (Ser/Thr protein kinase)